MIIREVMMLPSYTNGLEKGVFFWPQPKVISWVQFSGPKTGNARGADGNARTPLALWGARAAASTILCTWKECRRPDDRAIVATCTATQPPPPDPISFWWPAEHQHLFSVQWHHPDLDRFAVNVPCLSSPSLPLLAMKHQPVFHLPVKAKCLARKFIAFFIKNLHAGKIKSDLQSNELFCNLMKWCDLPRDSVQRVLCANPVLGTQEDFRDTNFSWVPCPPLKLQGYN